jgi:hypothetical protein
MYARNYAIFDEKFLDYGIVLSCVRLSHQPV